MRQTFIFDIDDRCCCAVRLPHAASSPYSELGVFCMAFDYVIDHLGRPQTRLINPTEPERLSRPAGDRRPDGSSTPTTSNDPRTDLRTPSTATSTLSALEGFLVDSGTPKSLATAILDSHSSVDLTVVLNKVAQRQAGDEHPVTQIESAASRRITVGLVPIETGLPHTPARSGSNRFDAVAYEPAFAIEVQWMLSDAIRLLHDPSGRSTYMRLSRRTVDQRLARVPTDSTSRTQRRRQVLAGAYILKYTESPTVTLVATGTVIVDAIVAAECLGRTGIRADVVCVTSPQQLLAAVQTRRGIGSAPAWILDEAFPALRAAPMVTLVDGHPQCLAFLTTVNDVPGLSLGVGGHTDPIGAPRGIHRDHAVRGIVRAALDLIR